VLQTLTGSNEEVTSVAVLPRGEQILSAGEYNKSPVVWDLATGKSVRTFAGNMNKVSAVAASPDGTQALTRDSAWGLNLWDVRTGEKLRQIVDPRNPGGPARRSPSRAGTP
jgi:WD40 repeat protein